MATTRPFAYNTGTTISGTLQYGNIVVGVDANIDYAGGGGNVRWWNGPDEDLGYVITYPNSLGNQPNPDSSPAFLGFKRSSVAFALSPQIILANASSLFDWQVSWTINSLA